MIISLFPNPHKKHSIEIAKSVERYLSKKNVTVVSCDDYASLFHAKSISSVDISSISFFIALGGDGTILHIIHKYHEWKIPILGINLGNLGFMAEVPVEKIFSSLDNLLEGKYKIENRMIIQGETLNKVCFAVNEIVIHRSTIPTLVELMIYVDGIYLNTFSSDGVIIATPNGSTAYSLSAGGPILTPELAALVITPICPIAISNRPIVLLPNHELEIKNISPNNPVAISCDGLSQFSLQHGESFKIKRSPHYFHLVNMKQSDYFSTLRSKLGWAMQRKNGNSNAVS